MLTALTFYVTLLLHKLLKNENNSTTHHKHLHGKAIPAYGPGITIQD